MPRLLPPPGDSHAQRERRPLPTTPRCLFRTTTTEGDGGITEELAGRDGGRRDSGREKRGGGGGWLETEIQREET